MDLIFDLDDTILSFEDEEYVALKKTFSFYGIEPSDRNIAVYREINSFLWAKIGEDGIDRDYIRKKRYEDFVSRMGLSINPREIADYYEEKLASGFAFMPEMPEILEKLIAMGHKIYLATNGITHIQRRRTANSGLDKYFTKRFVSEEIGSEKPSAVFFNHVTSNIDGFSKGRALMIGDNLKADILGANNVGIPSVWFNPKRKENTTGITPTYEIHGYEELLEIVEKRKA